MLATLFYHILSQQRDERVGGSGSDLPVSDLALHKDLNSNRYDCLAMPTQSPSP